MDNGDIQTWESYSQLKARSRDGHCPTQERKGASVPISKKKEGTCKLDE